MFNNGEMQRDFTYVDDIIEGIVRVIDNLPTSNLVWTDKKPDPSCSVAPYKIYNIGNSSPVKLMDFIEATEEAIGQTAKKTSCRFNREMFLLHGRMLKILLIISIINHRQKLMKELKNLSTGTKIIIAKLTLLYPFYFNL